MSSEQSEIPYRLEDWQAELDPRAAHRLFASLADVLGSDGTVVDVGTGTGHLADALATHGIPMVVLDVVDWRSPDVRLPFAMGEAAALPIATGACSGVHMARMLHHIINWRGALAEMVRVLRCGGTLCLSLGGWLDSGPLREVQAEVVDAAYRRGLVSAPIAGDLRSPADIDAELAALGAGDPELIEVTGTLVRTPREAVAELVGRTDRWQSHQDFGLLYQAGAEVLGSSSIHVDEAMVQQQHIAYRVYRAG